MSAAVRNKNRWRPVAGWAWYRISSAGVVQCCRERGPGEYLTAEWRTLAPTLTRDGYQQVRLWQPDRSVLVRVHSLVLRAFVGPCPADKQACHRDGNRLNNHLGNLRWGTPQENIDDRESHGRTARGERNGRAKLTAAQVAEIRTLRATRCPLLKIATRFGVSKRQVCRIVEGKSWTK